MSHGTAELGRRVFYTVPGRFSDVLRKDEFCDFFSKYDGASFSVRTLDGWSWTSPRAGVPQFVATFDSCATLDAMIEGASEATLGRLFLDGKLELDGNILVLLSIAQYTIRHSDGLSPSLVKAITRLSHHFSRKLIPIHRASSKQNWLYAPCPLDLPVSFYEPWLGSSLGHWCSALSENGDELQSAQSTALARACAYLEIEKGDRLLDAGCGWGSLLLHAAKRYGATGRGITSSERQKSIARDRIHSLSLDYECAVERLGPYLKSCRAREFDKVAHLGIFEQVGSSELGEYLRWLKELVVPGGLVLLHRLTSSAEAETCVTLLPSDFLSDGISRELELAERAGFNVVQIESLQSEYQRTLKIWIEHLLDTRRCATTRLFASGYRAWMLYLIEVAKCLNTGEAQVHRVVLRRRA